MTKNKKRIIGWGCAALLLVLLMVGAWQRWGATTRVAFVNYQVIALGEIAKANDNSFIKIAEVSTDEIDRLEGYDMVFVNAMGLRITEEQRMALQEAAEGGLPVLTTAATNPANDIVSLDSLQADTLTAYLRNGGRQNYRSMLNYVRKHIDGKIISIHQPEAVVKRQDYLLTHIDPKRPDEEPMGFQTVAAYDDFLRQQGLWREDAPRVIITGAMGDPKDVARRLEETGNMVYVVSDMRAFVQGHHADSVRPQAVINMAHGRMGDYMVDYLKRQNIPLFTTLNVNQLVEDWEADKMGMTGGFLSQSVVTPEIDGAIRPYALFGHYKDEEGLQHLRAIPERLETFVATVNKYIALQRKPNGEKRVAIYYYKGPGQNAMTAAGMEVAPSLYNLLVALRQAGYKVDGLPADYRGLAQMIQRQGAVFNAYAEGAFDAFMRSGKPALVGKADYAEWVKQSLRPELYEQVVKLYGEFPGDYMATADGQLGVPRLQFGNVVLLPQMAAGLGDNAFQIVHGTDQAPPHTYIASYLWARHGFHADAMIHFGTHGSLEFTPRKQVALSGLDWPDALVGDMPHFYLYSIADVGEGMIAKRRGYATLQSYLTPPFMESSLRDVYRQLTDQIAAYNKVIEQAGDGQPDSKRLQAASMGVKKYTVQMGLHRDLGLDSVMTKPYTEEEVARVENYAEELATEKITGQLYVMGVPYEEARIQSSVYAMATEPIAYSLLALDKQRGRVKGDVEKHRSLFTQRYLQPARELVRRLLANPSMGTDQMVCDIAGITAKELAKAHEIEASLRAPQGMMEMMQRMAGSKASAVPVEMKRRGGKPAGHPAMPRQGGNISEASRKQMLDMAKKMGATPEQLKRMSEKMGTKAQADARTGATQKQTYDKAERAFAQAVLEVERTVKNVGYYRRLLMESPREELRSMLNALNGGYTAPSPGGDPIVNPNTLPTGRNLYGINAEATPSEAAWEKGKQLAENTIRMYRQRHQDSVPRKVSYTLWSGEFIETEGVTIAQVLYMLGVEPIRDAFGRVTDLRLIPSKELGRPRIDVVVQTSGQLRDIAASRLFLINRAVEMAAAAKDDVYENQVSAGVVESERVLIEKGLSPKEAREMSAYRVFGGVNGGYGTGIQGMVMSGDRWESEAEIADTYLNNMGVFYGSEKQWETMRQYAFEAALTRTDAVIQPRQSNTWGALSLDHVYEFMGGMNLAVRNVTGKDPDAYLSDYRNRNHFRMQEVKEAIGVESRTTILNPAYIREKMKGDASGAHTFAEIVQNTYGWNVMKPKAVDRQLWDEIYDVYVNDKYQLGVHEYFEQKNPAALQEMTAVMMETARKGMWKASEQQLAALAELHTDLVNKYRPACSGMVCDNAKLRQFIAGKTDAATAKAYQQNITEVRQAAADGKQGMVMRKEELADQRAEGKTNAVSGTMVIGVAVVALVLLLLLVRYRRRKMRE